MTCPLEQICYTSVQVGLQAELKNHGKICPEDLNTGWSFYELYELRLYDKCKNLKTVASDVTNLGSWSIHHLSDSEL
jgi:hypothetical protein